MSTVCSRPLSTLTPLMLLCTLCGWGSTAEAESWTDLRGTQTIEAKMVGLWDSNVILQLQDGRRVSVNMNKLNGESRIQAQALAKELDRSRGQRVEELQGQAAEAAAPAPNPLPQPPAATAYTPPKAGASAADFLQQVDASVTAGHLVALFDALPPSYRADVNKVVAQASEKIRPEDWQTLFGTLHSVGDLVVTRQRWFLSSPRIAAIPEEQSAAVEEQILAVAGLLRAAFDPQVMDLDKLRSMPFGQWLTEADTVIAPHLALAFERLGNGASRTFTVESEKDGAAVVSVESGGQKSKVTYVAVDGFWVPKSLADKWTESITNVQTQLAAVPDQSLLTTVALMVQPVASMTAPLAAADDAQSFHAAMESMFNPDPTMMASVGSVLGNYVNLGGPNANRGGYGDGMGGYGESGYGDASMEGYDQMMEQQMNMEMERDMSMQGYGQGSSGPPPGTP